MAEQLRNLDFQLIERANEKYESLRDVTIFLDIDGKVESFVVEIYKNFSTTQMQMCVRELVDKLDNVKVHDPNGVEKIMIPYMMFLIIKHFTTLELPNSFQQQLQAIKHMTNTGTMFQIFMHMDGAELDKITGEIVDVVEKFNNNMEGVSDFKEKIKSMLTDKSLLE